MKILLPRKWESKVLLTNYLKETGARALHAEVADTNLREFFYSFDVICGSTKSVLGLSTNGDLFVSAVVSGDSTRALIGHDEQVLGISLAKPEMLFTYDQKFGLSGFNSFVAEIDNSVLVYWQLGITRLSFDGGVIWEFASPDLISGLSLSSDNEEIAIAFTEARFDPISLDIKSGRKIR